MSSSREDHSKDLAKEIIKDFYKQACKHYGVDHISPDLYEEWLEMELAEVNGKLENCKSIVESTNNDMIKLNDELDRYKKVFGEIKQITG